MDITYIYIFVLIIPSVVVNQAFAFYLIICAMFKLWAFPIVLMCIY